MPSMEASCWIVDLAEVPLRHHATALESQPQERDHLSVLFTAIHTLHGCGRIGFCTISSDRYCSSNLEMQAWLTCAAP
jgi:hypothetical protein